MNTNFKPTDRVIIRSAGGWMMDFIGTIKSLPTVARTIDRPDCTYWVEFDNSQYDLDGDGPYSQGEVLSRYLEPASTKYSVCKNLVFFQDGSLRDIYILNTAAEEWTRLFTFLRAQPDEIQTTLLMNNYPVPIPDNISGIFGKDRKSSIEMKTIVSGIDVRTHFFDIGRIDLDLDPREVQSEEAMNTLFKFFGDMAKTLEREIILTEESQEDIVLLIFCKNGEVNLGRKFA